MDNPASALTTSPLPASAATAGTPPVPIPLQVNGRSVTLRLDPRMPLVFALRDHLGLTGTKYSCLEGACGACTVHLDGQAVRACMMPLLAASGHEITTIEGLAGPDAQALRAAWTHHQVPQCGYCQSGQLMHAAAQLEGWRQRPARAGDAGLAAEVRDVMGQVLCRCGSYQRIQAAVLDAATSAQAEQPGPGAPVPPSDGSRT